MGENIVALNKTSIDWPGLTHTWNPGYGCLRNCTKETRGFDCYAKALHNMRMDAKKNGARLPAIYDKPFNMMQFFPNRLKIVKKSRVVKKVFVGSMTDICYWKREWTEKVLGVCKDRPEITFMFLTKNPLLYQAYKWPENCQLGVTITGNETIRAQWDSLAMIEALPYYTFISFEPLIGEIIYNPHETVNLVIVGADSTKGAKPPKKEWIKSIDHPNIHWKANIKKYKQG